MDPEDLWDTVLTDAAPIHSRRGQRGVLTLPDAYYQSSQALAPAFDPELSSAENEELFHAAHGSSEGKPLVRNLQLATEALPASIVDRGSPGLRIQSLPPNFAPDATWDQLGMEAQRWSPARGSPFGNAIARNVSKNSRNSGNSNHNSGLSRHRVMFDDSPTTALPGVELPPNHFRKPGEGVPWAKRPILRSRSQYGSIQGPQADKEDSNSAQDKQNSYRRARTYGGAPSSTGLDAVQTGSSRSRLQTRTDTDASGRCGSPGPAGSRSRLSGATAQPSEEERPSWRPTQTWRQQLELKVQEMALHRTSGSGVPSSSSLDRTPLPPHGVLSSSGRYVLQQGRLSSMSSPSSTPRVVTADGTGDLLSVFGLVGRSDAAPPLRRNAAASQPVDALPQQPPVAPLPLPKVCNSSVLGD